MSVSKLDKAEIFNTARKLDSPTARAAYLNEACGANELVRVKVGRLLGTRLPEKPIRIAAAVLFLVFGGVLVVDGLTG